MGATTCDDVMAVPLLRFFIMQPFPLWAFDEMAEQLPSNNVKL